MINSWLTRACTTTVSGPRPADDVWDRYIRPRRWPEWSPQINSVDYPYELLKPHTTGVVHGPAHLRVRFRVTDVIDDGTTREWSWTASAAGVQLHLRHTVRATTSGTRTALTVRGFAPAALLYQPIAARALRRLVR